MGYLRSYCPQAILVLSSLLVTTFAAELLGSDYLPEHRHVNCEPNTRNGYCVGERSITKRYALDNQIIYRNCLDLSCTQGTAKFSKWQINDVSPSCGATCACITEEVETKCSWNAEHKYFFCLYENSDDFNCTEIAITTDKPVVCRTTVQTDTCFYNNSQDVQYEISTCIDALTCNGCEGILCLHAQTLVDVPGGVKRAMDIYKGDFLLDEKGLPLEVLNTVKSGFSSEFVLIEKNALGPGEPFNSIMLTDHHAVIINGTEYLTKDLLGMNLDCKKVSLDESIPVFNFITENRSYYTLSGMKTVSWAPDEFHEIHGTRFGLQ